MTTSKTFYIGVTGPSGSGKSTVAKNLGFPVVGEDPATFANPEYVPYDQRNPDTERPTHVRWDLVQKHIHQVKDSVVVIEHFLLAFLPGIQLDLLIVLDDLGDDDDERGRVLRERRVGRQPNRPEQEQKDLRRYYDEAVWPIYKQETRPALQRLVGQLGVRKVLQLDPVRYDSNCILRDAQAFVQMSLDN